MKLSEKIETIRVTLCECGCGEPAPIATQTYRKRGWVRGQPLRFVRGHSLRGPQAGADNPAWKGGRKAGPSGYIMRYCPGHPRASKNYVLEHILMAEAALGHCLPSGAEVHHVDGDRAHNENSNLVVCQDRGYHMLLHQRARALAACGNPSALRCKYCRGYERQDEMKLVRRGGSVHGYHPSCHNAYTRARKARVA